MGLVKDINKKIAENCDRCDVSQITDGEHSFGELYDTNIRLFIALCNSNKRKSWFSKFNAKGVSVPGVIAGINIEGVAVTARISDEQASLLSIKEAKKAKEGVSFYSDQGRELLESLR